MTEIDYIGVKLNNFIRSIGKRKNSLLSATGEGMNNYKITLIGLTVSVIFYFFSIISGVDIFEMLLSVLEKFEKFEIDEFLIPIIVFGLFTIIDMFRKIKKNEIEQIRKKTFKKMERTALELDQLIDTANAPIFGVDIDGNINEWNQMVGRITGYSKEEVSGKNLVENYITDEYKASVKDVLDNALAGTETDNYQVPLFTKAGERVMVLLNATTRRDADGNIVGVVGVGQDITELSENRENLEGLIETRTDELKQALRDTENARDKIDVILKSIGDGLIVIDNNNKVVLLNPAAEDLLGTSFNSAINRHIDHAIRDKTLLKRIKTILDEFEAAPQLDFELWDNRSKKAQIMRARVSKINDKQDNPIGIVLVISDVTLEREVSRMKTEFLTTAAHELRTPLTSILGFSEILLSKDDFKLKEKNEFITYIHKESVSVVKIINDLLDVGRIEAGKKIPMNKGWCRAGDAIRQLATFFIKNCPNHQFEIVLPEAQHMMFVDKEKMGQVIKNILDNAVKYSPNGGEIRIRGNLIAGNYQVTVQDQGVGMNSDQTEKIFDKFYRASASQASGIRGVGLGMHIVKSIVESHKGKVWVQSELGKGTTVKFTIPMQNAELKD